MRTLVVDAANVVGSVPDGWWRDRRAATERLRDRLAASVFDFADDIVLVVEGQARGVAAVPGIEVVAAESDGDEAIVGVVARIGGPRCVVATSDRALAERVRALGAEVVGARRVR